MALLELDGNRIEEGLTRFAKTVVLTPQVLVHGVLLPWKRTRAGEWFVTNWDPFELDWPGSDEDNGNGR